VLKQRIHSTVINFGEPRPVSDLIGLAGELLQKLELPGAMAPVAQRLAAPDRRARPTDRRGRQGARGDRR